ncbi:MAG TPA: hypothetical protein VFC47_10335 [Caulobacteraceae bacterium]|nr:hypothetical protein [Caulobacteraceae bacterium]
MTSPPPLRRLIDLPGIAELERAAVMKPLPAPGEAAAGSPEIDGCSMALFGLTADQAAAVGRPEGWDGIEDRPIARQVAAFEAAGWDVGDKRGKPLRVLEHFNTQLWLAIRGVAGNLPYQAEPGPDNHGDWGSTLASEAERFRRR